MKLNHLIDRMIAAGLSPAEAGSIAAEIYAAGVAAASTRSPGAERTRRWREKQASQSDGNRHETSHGDAGKEASQSVTERHKASQSDASAVSPIENKIKNSKRQNSERASRGTRIAPDWVPSTADRQLARQEGFSEAEIDRQALRFRDYWVGRAGSGGVKLDWAATWRNWIRTSAENLGKAPTHAGGSSSPDDGLIEVMGDEELAAWDAYGRQKSGKSFPRNARGGWRFPSRWPPGYVPSKNGPVELPKLQSMRLVGN